MPVKRRKAKARHHDLSLGQFWDLVLGRSDRDAFDTEEERREAWQVHRERCMAFGRQPGKRPAAWWDYEAPQPRERDTHEILQMYRIGALQGGELAAVMARWREWAEKAASGLHYTRGPGDILEGAEAVEAWRIWAGIPDELFRDDADEDVSDDNA